jgi:hypothetical protein
MIGFGSEQFSLPLNNTRALSSIHRFIQTAVFPITDSERAYSVQNPSYH